MVRETLCTSDRPQVRKSMIASAERCERLGDKIDSRSDRVAIRLWDAASNLSERCAAECDRWFVNFFRRAGAGALNLLADGFSCLGTESEDFLYRRALTYRHEASKGVARKSAAAAEPVPTPEPAPKMEGRQSMIASAKRSERTATNVDATLGRASNIFIRLGQRLEDRAGSKPGVVNIARRVTGKVAFVAGSVLELATVVLMGFFMGRADYAYKESKRGLPKKDDTASK
jgi:hypothetical protein